MHRAAAALRSDHTAASRVSHCKSQAAQSMVFTTHAMADGSNCAVISRITATV
jgi:hypothetical protein